MKKFFKRALLVIAILLLLLISNFLIVKKLDNEAMEMRDFYTSSYNTSKPILLPSLFLNGERFYVKMPTTNGDTALAYGDSGGGISMINPSVTDKFNLGSKIKTALLKGAMPMKLIMFKDMITNELIPSPMPLREKIFRRPFSRITEPLFIIPPVDEELQFIMKAQPFDLFLGQNFFMGKAWTIDYINKQIWVNTPLPASEAGKPGVQKIGFKKNNNNESIYGHASMFIEVNGEIIEVLFDTGATIVLSDDGKKALNTTEKTIGGSFIAKSIFDKWHHDHPEWKYYPHADIKNDIIEVPIVKIGGHEVGPVLFASRPDEVWSQGMIGTMDKVVRGAIGGSGLKYLKVTIDYNSDLIRFEK